MPPIYLLSSFFFFLTTLSYSQNCIPQPRKIAWSDALETFNVCDITNQDGFDDKKEYYWYNDIADEIKTTTGGAGGALLHGDYKLYDEEGNYLKLRQYHYGLLHGNSKKWNKDGDLIEVSRYNMGEMEYFKVNNLDGTSLEYVGTWFQPGWIGNIYSKTGQLIKKEVLQSNGLFYVETYYAGAGKIREEYFASLLNEKHGEYKYYYESGFLGFHGFYHEKFPDIRIGTWDWYNDQGEEHTLIFFDIYEEYWNNGNPKVIGGYLNNVKTKEDEKVGTWKWFNEDGDVIKEEAYSEIIMN